MFFDQLSLSSIFFVAGAGLFAGIQNVLAGGGSFITFPALLLAGLDPLAANMTSTIALFPNQITSSFAGRHLVAGVGKLRFRSLFVTSIVGGVLGALLLLSTPVGIFTSMVPWLVLFATATFTWGSFFRKPGSEAIGTRLSNGWLLGIQGLIAIYGGYFGGGIGFLMLAALTVAGQQVRSATATKNALAMTMNAAAVAVFAMSPLINWPAAVALGVGGIAGAIIGSWLMYRLPAALLRGFVVVVGILLTIWLFIR